VVPCLPTGRRDTIKINYYMMKKLSVLLFFAVLGNILFAQSKHEALNADKILWFGLDFSNARFIDEFGFKSAETLKNKYFKQWNRLLIEEPEKYNISSFFRVPKVESDYGEVYKRNENVDPAKIILDITAMDYTLDENKIKEIIGQYETSYDGYGLVFIIDNFNKPKLQAAMWVTYFYIPTKQVVFTKRMVGEPGGFGMRNFWASSLYKVFQKCNTEKTYWLEDK
jgi:hypothetical protein